MGDNGLIEALQKYWENSLNFVTHKCVVCGKKVCISPLDKEKVCECGGGFEEIKK